MNEQQRLYLVQARSDWEVFHVLEGQAICHRLHYLQMCTEKLAKAYFWSEPSAGEIGHSAFARFLREIATYRSVGSVLGFPNRVSFRESIKAALPLAYEIERLAPSLAGEGPNPEYPWPRVLPGHAPVEREFPLWGRLQTRVGQTLLWALGRLLIQFAILF